MKKDAEFWKNEFSRYAADMNKIQTRPTSEIDRFFVSWQDRLWPMDYWLDLSKNPIVDVRPAYSDLEFLPGFEMGAEIFLSDGHVYRHDMLHGGGFWQMRQNSDESEARFRWSMSVHNAHDAKSHFNRCIEAAEDASVSEDEILKQWVLCDKHTKDAALFALIFFLYWMKGE